MKTTRGLPNTCSQCGTPVKKEDGWFAKNEDEARSGQGLCEKCARKSTRTPEPSIQEQPADETVSPQDEQGEQPAETPAPISEGVTVEELRRRK